MMNRCPHGVYVPQGEETARNCSWCNPSSMGIIGNPKPRHVHHQAERTLDAAEYLLQPSGTRITEGLNAVEL
jgi:hypothetical protein